eukprot:9097639-Karenia_brevis.AAC.1
MVETVINVQVTDMKKRTCRNFQSRKTIPRGESHMWRFSAAKIERSGIHDHPLSAILLTDKENP